MSLFENPVTGHISHPTAGRVAVEFDLHKEKDRVVLRSIEGEAGECFGVIYLRKTPTIEIGQGYLTFKGRSGHDLQGTKKVTFPTPIVELAKKVQERQAAA